MPELTCQHCGKKFVTRWNGNSAVRKYCSNPCKDTHRRKRTAYSLPCTICGKIVTRIKHSKPKIVLCSPACVGKYKTIKASTVRVCAICGKEFSCRAKTSQRICTRKCGTKSMVEKVCEHCSKSYKVTAKDASGSKFCSRECRAKIHSVTAKCVVCNAEYKIRLSHSSNTKYCSYACMAEDQKTRFAGSMNPNYRDSGHRVCEHCGADYKSYTKTRKYCSKQCSINHQRRHAVRGARIDGNHTEIVSALRSVGVTVISLASVAFGCPDLAAGYGGSTFLLEIKTEKGTLTNHQKEWIPAWKGHVAIVRSPQEAYNAVGISASYMGGGSGILL